MHKENHVLAGYLIHIHHISYFCHHYCCYFYDSLIESITTESEQFIHVKDVGWWPSTSAILLIQMQKKLNMALFMRVNCLWK